jgi:hypothetical protein
MQDEDCNVGIVSPKDELHAPAVLRNGIVGANSIVQIAPDNHTYPYQAILSTLLTLEKHPFLALTVVTD